MIVKHFRCGEHKFRFVTQRTQLSSCSTFAMLRVSLFFFQVNMYTSVAQLFAVCKEAFLPKLHIALPRPA